jgi:hypothetical protein
VPFLGLPAEPRSVTKIVADGRHNAFAAFTQWKGQYWLAFRKGSGHIARDGDMVVLGSSDAHEWQEVRRFDVCGDDRDAQLVATQERLWLYINSLKDGVSKVFVSYSEDGRNWSPPQAVYRDGFILWKPVEHNGRFYAGAHRPGPNDQRLAHLVTSADGLDWQRISTIREATGESETALCFDQAGKLTAFLRDQTKIGGAILEACPPFTEWSQRPAGVHLSGQAVYTFDGITYLLSRVFGCDPPVEAAADRSALPEKVDQATMVYTYEDGALTPYCLLGPLAGNHDSSYATAVREGDDMLVVFHRSAHEYAGAFRGKDAADLFLARVPLKNKDED